MKPAVKEAALLKNDDPGSFIGKLRQRKIIETSATFLASSWLTYEIVHWILVAHFHLPEGLLDITLMTLAGAFAGLLVQLWFGGARERPPGIRVEVLAVPLIVLLTLAVDVKLILRIFDIPGKTSLIGMITLGLGVAWIVAKSLHWAARAPGTGERRPRTSSTRIRNPKNPSSSSPSRTSAPRTARNISATGSPRRSSPPFPGSGLSA